MSREAEEQFAALIDYMRDYRDCAESFSETGKFEIYDEMQAQIDALKALGISLCYSTRTLQFKATEVVDAKPFPMTAMYLVTFPLGKEPKQFSTPCEVKIGA